MSLILRRKLAYTCLAMVTLTTACTLFPNQISGERQAISVNNDPFDPAIQYLIYPAQNWTANDSLWFYTTPQGSNLLPYALFLHLEQVDNTALFRSAANMNRLRYLPQAASPENPEGLPVGWVKETYKGADYVGLSCAACHTSEIHVGKTAIRIDGGPAQADMDLMMRELEASLQATRQSPQKFARLYQAMRNEDTSLTEESLRALLLATTTELAFYNHSNAPLHQGERVEYGYSRLDAFGRIYNRIFAHLTPGQDNFTPANAPVSYPFLWDTPQHDFVQWNGVGDNANAGALGRNTGEVLGVFATMDINPDDWTQGYPSSALMNELAEMENTIARLESPSWSELAARGALPAIDKALAEEGKTLYADYQCGACHQAIVRNDPAREVNAQFASLARIGTDPSMAMNALTHSGNSGYLQGRPYSFLAPTIGTFGEKTSALTALSHVTEGVILHATTPRDVQVSTPNHSGFTTAQGATSGRETQRSLDFTIVDKKKPESLLAYKARPLNGIWATAPYLHNGSVPTLDDLFKPSCSDADITAGKDCRPNRFTLGSRVLDTQKVGFTERAPSDFPGIFVFDTQLPGNSNQGHEYTAGVTPMIRLDAQGAPIKNADGSVQTFTFPPMTPSQRRALVEFLKTL